MSGHRGRGARQATISISSDQSRRKTVDTPHTQGSSTCLSEITPTFSFRTKTKAERERNKAQASRGRARGAVEGRGFSPHLVMDVNTFLDKVAMGAVQCDVLVAHPPCTLRTLAVCGGALWAHAHAAWAKGAW